MPTHPIARVVLQLRQHIQDLHSSHLLLKLLGCQHSRRPLPVWLHNLLLAALLTHCCCGSWARLTARLQLHVLRFLHCMAAVLTPVSCAVSCCCCPFMLPVQCQGCEDAGQHNP